VRQALERTPAPLSPCTNTSPPSTTNRPAVAWCSPGSIERVTETLAGRDGAFLLQDAGTVQGSIVSGDWFVIPGSGTGQLAGLRGEGGFRANLGEGAQVHLDYWFE
jgi:hypothetical protein